MARVKPSKPEVSRAVRATGGVSSAPMTVKVFRVDPRRPPADELRSWDKGDAVLIPENTPHWYSEVDGEIAYLEVRFSVPAK